MSSDHGEFDVAPTESKTTRFRLETFLAEAVGGPGGIRFA